MLKKKTIIASKIDVEENLQLHQTVPNAIKFIFTEEAAFKLQNALNWLLINDNGDKVEFNELLEYELLEQRGNHINVDDPSTFQLINEFDLIIVDSHIGITKNGYVFAEFSTDESKIWCDICHFNEIYSPADNEPMQSSTSVSVRNWDLYGDGNNDTDNTYEFEIDDQRNTHGQSYMTIANVNGNVDDLLSIRMEVKENPLNPIDCVPAAHVNFDSDNAVFSLYKIGERVLVEIPKDVSLHFFHQKINGVESKFIWFE